MIYTHCVASMILGFNLEALMHGQIGIQTESSMVFTFCLTAS